MMFDDFLRGLRDLERYLKRMDGTHLVKVTLPVDGDGMLGRECPNEDCHPRYFKVYPSAEEGPLGAVGGPVRPLGATAQPLYGKVSPLAEPVLPLSRTIIEDENDRAWCPYCGHEADSQDFATEDQIEYARSVALRQFTADLQRQLKRLEQRPKRHAFISIGVQVKPGALPRLHHYQEQELRREISCPHCQYAQAIYGISFYCHNCGQITILSHIDRSLDQLRKPLEHEDLVRQIYGDEGYEQVLKGILKDAVSLWEGYLKVVHRQAIRRRYSKDEVADIEGRMRGNVFQRFDDSITHYREDLTVDLLSGLTAEDTAFLRSEFHKRHILTHNLGLIDERYLHQTADLAGGIGREATVSSQEVKRLLDHVTRVLKTAGETLRVRE